MMIEQNTNYAYKLKYMENPTFDKVRDLAIKFMRELPTQLQDELYEALNRGVDILDSEPQMVTYLYAFGPMHQAKLNYAFKHLPEKFFEQPEINVIDFGCGQALGTICYADFLRENGYSQRIKTLTLIEPSEICLKRAALHASMFLHDAEIKTVNKKFDDLTIDDIKCSKEVPTLHIFSNVLDMQCFDLNQCTSLINGSLEGYNQFVCVGPFFNYSDKDNRMERFCALLNGNEYYSKSFDKYEFDEQKAWTARILCFAVDKANTDAFSTEITKAEIDNGDEDEFGVVYSIDGKRLLRCKNFSIETYSIKQGTEVVCDLAFGDFFWNSCESLREIIIPNSVKSFGFGAFSGCNSLRQITIPNSVISIGEQSFSECKSLQQIIIPNSVIKIGDAAFWMCKSLQQIIIPKGSDGKFKKMLDEELWDKLVETSTDSEILSSEANGNGLEETIEDEHGVVYNRDGNRLLKCKNKNIESYIIRQGTKTICDSAFLKIGTLKQIVIPDSVTDIENQAFCGCKSLQKINIPNSVTSIGYNAFGLCESLQKINIPDSVSFLGPATFHKCVSLQQVKISNSLERIDYMTFCECTSLHQIVIPNSITVISDWAFSECKSLNHIVIPDLVTYIGQGAFSKCSSLQHVTLPRCLCSLGWFAFEECKSLHKITIPDSANRIRAGAFSGCVSLQQIIIPDSVTEIGDEILYEKVFNNCKSLQQIVIPKGSTEKFKEMLDEELWDKLVEQ